MKQKAEELFKKYSGSHYQMERDNVLDEYRKFNISMELEEKWKTELFENVASVFKKKLLANNHFDQMVNLVKKTKNTKLLHNFINLLKKVFIALDSFTKIRLCEEIVQILEYVKKKKCYNPNDLSELEMLFRDILFSIDEGKLSVNPYYYNLPYLAGLLSDEQLKARLQRLKKVSNVKSCMLGSDQK